MKEAKSGRKWLYWFIFAVAVIIVYKTLDNFSDITAWFGRLFSLLMPFFMGILIAYLLYTPCKSIERALIKGKMTKKHARGLSVAITYFLVVLAIIFIINILLPAISESVIDLANNLPTYYKNAIEYVENMPDNTLVEKESIEEAIANLQKIDITKILNIETITDYINKAMGIANGIFNTFVTIVMSIYILLERNEILTFLRRLNCSIFKEETSKKIDAYFIQTNTIFFRFISSQIIDGIIVGIITSIAMWIMGIKYAALLGMMIGLFNIIPYFGAIIAIVVAGIITIFTGGIGQAIWFAIVVTILQQIDANIINPKIVGNALKLSPILVIFSVTVGGAYFGVLGMFLAVPVIAVIKILINDYIEHKLRLRKKQEELSD